MALIASALAYADKQKAVSKTAAKPDAVISRWAIAGRMNSLTNRV